MNTLVAIIVMVTVTGWPFLLVGVKARARPLPEPITVKEASLICVFFTIAFVAGVGVGVMHGN